MIFRHPSCPGRGAAPMGQYRLYYLDSVDRLISGSFEFEAADDEAAAQLAEHVREGRAAELWCGERKLKVWG